MKEKSIEEMLAHGDVASCTHFISNFQQYIQLALALGYRKMEDMKKILVDIDSENNTLAPSGELSFPCIVSASPIGVDGEFNWRVSKA